LLHNYTADNLLFNSLLLNTGHGLCAPISDDAILAPFLHGWRVLVLTESLDTHALENWTFRVWHKLDIVVRITKIKHPETWKAHLIDWGLDDLKN
jgi:hypothetical protein